MKKAYNKDIWRAIWKGKKRFFAIMIITVLGVAMFSGLKASCVDLRHSADDFFDAQNLYDISVVSTLGLTEEDIDTLAALDGVESAEGAYSETIHMQIGDSDRSVALKTLSTSGMNEPYLLEGELPQNTQEAAVTIRFAEDTGAELGDTITIHEDLEDEENPSFLYTEYKISAVVVDPMDINNSGGAVSFRSSSTDDYTVFVRPEAVESDVYTAVYLTLSGARDLFCYGEDYEAYVAQVTERIESEIKEQREQARYDEITGEAYEELVDARAEAAEEFANAEKELEEAAEEITEGKEELADGERELREKEQEAAEGFAEARKELADGKTKLEEGRSKLAAAEQQLIAGEAQLSQAKQTLTEKETEAYAQIKDGRAALTARLTEIQTQKEELQTQLAAVMGTLGELWPQTEWDAYVQTVTEAYVPLIEEQIAAETGSSGNETENSVSGTESNGTGSSAPGAVVSDAVNVQEQTFLTAMQTAVTTAKTGIDYQIAGVDTTLPDYLQQIAALEAQKQQLDTLVSQLPSLAVAIGQIQATEQVLGAQLTILDKQETAAKQEFANAWQEIAGGEAELANGKRQLAAGKAEFSANETALANGEAELAEKEAEAESQIADGWKEIEDGRRELADGEAELADGWEEFEEKKAEVEQKFLDAEAEIEDIDMTQWYVQDRTSLSGYANVKSDADSIESIGTVFPIVFFVVAILISLTTITRMVEEDRGLIGTYKALGFTDREIRKKYLLYAFLASAMGSIVGTICAFIVLPGIIFVIFGEMYLLPDFIFLFEPTNGILGPAIFMAGIVGATAIACKTELLQMPAVLMRPKAPRSGSRVLLERIKPIWNHLSFLNKVTARNLFRYKKRLFMTIAGIMGCMALLLFGFAIKDSVTDLMPRQYEQVYRYDVMAVTMADDNEKLLSYVSEEKEVTSYLNAQIENVQLKSESGEEKVQLFVVPEEVGFEKYICLENLDGEPVTLNAGGIYITQNAADVLEFDEGDVVSIQRMDLTQQEAEVTTIVKNYLGNNIYMTQATYEELFGAYEPNGVLVELSEECTDPKAYAERLGEKEGVLTSMSTEELKADFSQAFTLINMVVYIVIIMAAALAFVVLFTLSTTNISERQRELATIKVLGFYDREVHLYVNKETLILTGVGILLGIPLGYAFAQTLTMILRIPSIYLAVSLHMESYLIAAGISILFALIVNVITDRSLDGIDPVEALKSIE